MVEKLLYFRELFDLCFYILSILLFNSIGDSKAVFYHSLLWIYGIIIDNNFPHNRNCWFHFDLSFLKKNLFFNKNRLINIVNNGTLLLFFLKLINE